MQNETKKSIAVFVGLLVVCVAVRIAKPVPHFVPVAGAAIFAGWYLRNQWLACLLPLAAMLISDQFLDAHYNTWVMLVVYASYLVPIVLVRVLQGFRTRPAVWRIGATTLVSAAIWFLTTNCAVWALETWHSFPPTIAGLMACYAGAFPFLIPRLIGDLVWTGVLFGGYVLFVEPRFDAEANLVASES